MKSIETIELSPVKPDDYPKMIEVVCELLNTLINRTDGAKIEIIRDTQFPPLNGKPLISGFKVEMWDIAA